MKKTLGRWFRRLADRWSPVVLPDPVGPLDRIEYCIEELNDALRSAPYGYYPWTDWSERPAKVILCLRKPGGMSSEIIYPVELRNVA